MKNTVDKSIFILLPVFSAASSIKGPTVLGFSYAGFIWSFYFIFGLLLIFIHRQHSSFPTRIWAPWFVWVALSFFWSPMTIRDNLQIAVQIISPLIIAIVASYYINSEKQWRILVRYFVFCIPLIFVAFLVFPSDTETIRAGASVFFKARTAATTLTIIACIFVARFKEERILSFLGWAFCISITIASGSRTATVVILLLWLFSPNLGGFFRKIFILFAIMIFSVILFYSPIFQERFFQSSSGFRGEGTLDEIPRGEFADQGRFNIWPLVWEEAFHHPLIGSGVGSSQPLMRIHFEDVEHVHNDFLRIFFEMGLVGLTLFLSAVFCQIFHLTKIMGQRTGFQRDAAIAGALGLTAWLLISATDNLIIYCLPFTYPLFALLGSAYGPARSSKPAKIRI